MPAVRPRILIADDEPLFLHTTGELLNKAGYDCTCVSDSRRALAALNADPFDLVLSDLNMPGNLQGELLRAQRSGWPQVPLIVVTGVPSMPSAIEGIRLGVADYLLKPVRFEELLASVRKALTPIRPATAVAPEENSPEPAVWSQLVGGSGAMQQVREICERAAANRSSVLITGEHGTGKHLVARLLHEAGPTQSAPFRRIRCTDLATGGSASSATSDAADDEAWSQLHRAGSLYLADVDTLSAPAQARLQARLAALRSGGGSARLFSSALGGLAKKVRAGQFREDLYYTLAVVQLALPPLRERGTDLEELAKRFLKQIAAATNRPVCRVASETLQLLYQHSWPGNVHELKNAMQHAATVAQDRLIRPNDLPPSLVNTSGEVAGAALLASQNASRQAAVTQAERHYLLRLLRDHHGNVSRAARDAGLSRQGLHKLLARHGIDPDEFR